MKTNQLEHRTIKYKWLAFIVLSLALFISMVPLYAPAFAAEQTFDFKYEVRNNSTDCNNGQYKGHLFRSSQGSRDWQEIGQQFNGNVVSVGATSIDSRSVYVLAADSALDLHREPTYSIYFSADAGQTWQKRYQGGKLPVVSCAADSYNKVYGLVDLLSPVDVVVFSYLSSLGGSSGSNFTNFISVDGARSFTEIGDENDHYHHLDFYNTNEGIIRYFNRNKEPLALSKDGGKTWQTLKMPEYKEAFTCNGPYCGNFVMRQPFNAQGNLFFYWQVSSGVSKENYKDAEVWYSADNGRDWQKVAIGLVNLEFNSYTPLAVTGRDQDEKPVTIALPSDPDRFKTDPVKPNNASGGVFFSETGHNLWGTFQAFWEKQGGLAQFGYPKTEPFYEFNPADGKVYLAQYFERNRFEYHPEFAGTQYEVLLGLLGNQLTAGRRAGGEGAFNRFEDMQYPGGSYFPATGHNLRNSFKAYWEANGGLSLYGYPISEEFEEVNPDDGKTYVVQYFERNRFEYHPENKGTKYEVLLGLLGNTLLRQRGWVSS